MTQQTATSGSTTTAKAENGSKDDDKQQKPPPSAATATAAPPKKSSARSGYKVPLSTNRPPPDPDAPLIPQKIGKANPTRDIGFFLGFVFVMFFVSWLYKDVGRNPDNFDPKGQRPNILNVKQFRKKMIQALAMAARDKSGLEMQEERREDCNLFVHKSSIPGTAGLGFFAGTNYSQGTEIMSLGLPLVDIPVEEGAFYSFPPLSLLLKHHPTLANVEPTSSDGGPLLWSLNDNSDRRVFLRATRDIEPGQELFLKLEDHPASVLPDLYDNRIPTLKEYKEADEIIAEERSIFTRTANHVVNKKRSNEVGYGLRMTQKAVARYRPVVAGLLPIMADPLVAYNTQGKSSVTQALNNQTWESLLEYGVCASDYHEESGTVGRATKEGLRAMPVPLYVTTEAGEQCSSEDDNSSCKTLKKGCLYRSDSALVICPLVQVEYVASSSSSDDESSSAANVKFQWSSWNPTNGTKKVPRAILEKYSMELAWDAIALKPLEAGEKIVVAMDQDAETGAFMVPDELFPEKWIQE